jgi:hypothetical protein
MREIEDSRLLFIIVIILALAFSSMIAWKMVALEEYQNTEIRLFVRTIGILFSCGGICIFSVLGMTQMYSDKTKKISALLATLAVSRFTIFTARVLTGILLILLWLMPVFITVEFATRSLPIVNTGIFPGPQVWAVIFMICLASYCIGLQAGWTAGKITPTLGALGLSFIMVWILLIKGFRPDIYVILILLIAGCLLRAWRTFSTAAL